MKHRRAGPTNPPKPRSMSRPKPRPRPSSQAKDKTPKKVVGPTPPRPIGPWAAMKALLADEKVPPTIIDVGAHYGNVTNHFLQLWPRAHVYCFEPEPEGLDRLYDRFDSDPRVTIVPLALGSRQGKATFYICGQNTEMSSLLPRAEWEGRRYYRHEVRDTIEVEVDTLDNFMSVEGIEEVHLLKMDVQGGEKGVLNGAKHALSKGRFRAIYSEVLFVQLYRKAALFWELCRYLDSFHYTVFDLYNLQRSWINRQLKYGDALWIDKQLRERTNKYPEEWMKKSLPQRMCPLS